MFDITEYQVLVLLCYWSGLTAAFELYLKPPLYKDKGHNLGQKKCRKGK